MKKHTSRQSSRKAPEGRAGQVSSTANTSVESPGPASPLYMAQLIKLGVDTHAGRYVLARMVDNQNAQPPQAMGPEAFLAYLQKQKGLAARVVMVYEAGPYGFSLYRQATAMGVQCLVCAP